MNKFFPFWDIKLFWAINQFRSPFLDHFLPYFSQENFIYAFFIFFFLWCFFIKGKKAFLLIFVALLLYLGTDFICGRILKPYFSRPRPCQVLKGAYVYKNKKFIKNKKLSSSSSFSFPSCHAANVSCIAAFLSRELPLASPILLFFTILVGYSRIYLGVHYPLDILAGFLLGGALGFVGHYIFHKWNYL